MTFNMENGLCAIAIPGSIGNITALCRFVEAARVLLSAGLVSNLFAVLLCLACFVLNLLDVSLC